MTVLASTGRVRVLLALLACAGAACGGGGEVKDGEGDADDGNGDASDSDGNDTGDGDGDDGNGGDGAGDNEMGDGEPGGGGDSMMLPVSPGEVISDPPDVGLPAVRRFVNVRAKTVGDSASITFDPIDGAVDYRVYALPAGEDVSVAEDGHVTIQNAVYRCAGSRQGPAVTVDGAAQVQSGTIKTLVDGQDVGGYTRSLAEATLGHVYASPGDGRIPVYALGDSDPKADNRFDCYFMRWTASRVKHYVTSTEERDQLLAEGFRDDGIAFYVPAAESDATKSIFTSTSANGMARYYFAEGPEAAARDNESSAFPVLAEEAEGTVPLKRVFYSVMDFCGASHDELVAGEARFEHVRRQGDQVPITRLHWSGLSGPTTLVIEALDQGCPFQGLITPKSQAGYVSTFLEPDVVYQAWSTPEDVQASSPGGELFINGQFDGTNPKAIARTFVQVQPADDPGLDWSFGFAAGDDFGAQQETADCGLSSDQCFADSRFTTSRADITFYDTEYEHERHAADEMFGEWWVSYADLGSDSNGKSRLTPTTKGEMTADSFLYVTMDVDAFSTARRYPQILISDRNIPVQVNLPQGNTLVLQTFGDWPNRYELQVCDHKNWDVNDQCPRFDFYNQRDPNDVNTITRLAPNAEVGEQVGLDDPTRFEIYVSTQRAYVYLDSKPYGCANLPAAGVPSGAVTVTFGDVLYHAEVDLTFDFTGRHRQNDSVRHFDNMGFKSNVPAPSWDHTRFPCTSHLLTD